MHARKECYQCLKNLTFKTIDLALSQKSSLVNKKVSLETTMLSMLNQQFDTNKIPALIFTKLNRRVKNLTQVNDAFKKRKKKEMEIARYVSTHLLKNCRFNLKELLLFSAAGNSIDFFKDLQHSAWEMQRRIMFSKDNTLRLKKQLQTAKIIVFFADNAGECYFDLPLVKFLARKAKVIYVVKSKAVQNDLTSADLKNSHLLHKFPQVVASGNDAVGMELATISKKLKKELERCDVIIAKGMGYYETFTELTHFSGKIFHLLMAKCPPVARHIGVRLNSYVLLKR